VDKEDGTKKALEEAKETIAKLSKSLEDMQK